MSMPRGQGRGFLFALLARCEQDTRPSSYWQFDSHQAVADLYLLNY